MGCMLRSDKMTFCDIFIQPEAGFEILSRLGEEGCVQFEDMTPELSAFQRNFMQEFCRCTDLERTLISFQTEMKKDRLAIPAMKSEPPALHPNMLNEFEALLEKLDVGLRDMEQYQTKLLKSLMHLQEMHYVLTDVEPILGNAEIRRDTMLKNNSHGGGDIHSGGKLYFQTGVVKREKCHAFQTMLWRISRGCIYFRTVEHDRLFENPHTGNMVRKVAFIIIAQGDALKTIADKVCSGFHAKLYPIPRKAGERDDMIKKLTSRIADLNQVILKTKYHRCKQLRTVGKTWEHWLVQVRKTKMIYYYLNFFRKDITQNCLIGRGWIPTQDLSAVHDILDMGGSKSGSKVASFMSKGHTIATPPTYHRTNRFTRGFQNLISAYGDATYRELNPGLYTLITFPFLFAVMFGDCGHAAIMLSFAIWMVLNEKKFMRQRSTNEIWRIFFGGRYVILLMGAFSMYTGFLYNDWFSKPLRLKSNYWINTFSVEELKLNETLTLDPAGKTKSLYLFGVDPCWANSKNKIMHENSLKMKMSVILGIIHMMFGLWLSLFNHLYFKRYYAIILEFIPQLLFLTCLFVWLVLLMFFKWILYGPKEKHVKRQPGCAPLILILFIDMCLMRETTVEEGSVCDPYMFDNQRTIQITLLFLALINIPILLFGSPLYILRVNKKKLPVAKEELASYRLLHEKSLKPKVAVKSSAVPSEFVDETEEIFAKRVDKYSEGFGELMIHQGVHTIEYVLSTISHTASYLRLWALSLAHAQLSEMLWEMVLSQLALQVHSWVGCIRLYIIFAVWASFSISILVVMEGLSAFLHTLRLHWVEFMSKFYSGGGIIFHPFNYRDIIDGEFKDEKNITSGCTKKA